MAFGDLLGRARPDGHPEPFVRSHDAGEDRAISPDHEEHLAVGSPLLSEGSESSDRGLRVTLQRPSIS